MIKFNVVQDVGVLHDTITATETEAQYHLQYTDKPGIKVKDDGNGYVICLGQTQMRLDYGDMADMLACLAALSQVQGHKLMNIQLVPQGKSVNLKF